MVYDGNGLKTFELLRKEYDRDVTKEEILLIQENEAALKKWKKYYKKAVTEPGTVEKQEFTEQDAGRNYNPLAFYAAHTEPSPWEPRHRIESMPITGNSTHRRQVLYT